MAVDSKDFKSSAEAARQFEHDLLSLLSSIRHVSQEPLKDAGQEQQQPPNTIDRIIQYHASSLRTTNQPLDADALDQLHDKVTCSPAYGGLDLSGASLPSAAQYEELLFQTSAYLESANSHFKARSYLIPRSTPSSSSSQQPTTKKAEPMTLAQKIVTQHALGQPTSSLAPGSVLRTGIDWVLASELSWASMASTHADLGSPGIWRNDRFWLAGDHVVHPSLGSDPKIRVYVEKAEQAKRAFRMTEFQGMNYTIMHTEFVRQRAEPGMLVIGSDSHSCSAGAVGCLSVGLGAADVMLALALGETWFKVPDSVWVEFVGTPGIGVAGKDVILYVLGVLKRNTVAAERIVEFGGEGVRHLSVDARFAICNMCAEFGAVTGVFVPDGITRVYVEGRRRRANKSSSLYFRPDPDARYAERCTIDLAKVQHAIAVYPEPDHVVPVAEKVGMHLDGVFIGACTTTEEELVLAALVLKAGLEQKLPMAKGKRHYVPGSMPIVEKLRELGLLEIYEAAGFTRGPPGCSLCVGLTAEKASEGETWLSSQNRNFKNRMGKGSFGHLSSAVVCAASSFSMSVTDPATLLKEFDVGFFENYRGKPGDTLPQVDYVEPKPCEDEAPDEQDPPGLESTESHEDGMITVIESKVVTLGDLIDTDALSPGFTLTDCKTDEEFGQHVLCYTHPDFRDKVKQGQRVVVAGHAFGVGSSRETAVQALKGAGVQAVIARSFAFIYGRNQPSLGLLGIVMEDEAFYAAAKEGEIISIDLRGRNILVAGKKFPFQLSEIEYHLTQNKGVTECYRKYGKAIWEKLTTGKDGVESHDVGKVEPVTLDSRLNW